MAFAAISGGANIVIIHGLKDITQQSPGFAQRMSRNIQILLKEEANAGFGLMTPEKVLILLKV